jgi:hypothetical protein
MLMKERIEMRLIKATQNGSLYEDNDGKIYLLKNSTHHSEKSPIYYISELKNGKADFITGIWKLNNGYQGDIKDVQTGLKTVLIFQFSENGKGLVISQK